MILETYIFYTNDLLLKKVNGMLLYVGHWEVELYSETLVVGIFLYISRIKI